ncbi:endonuclease/exonuclease/phosphatase family protein [Streptacidiphilus sp. ASG 303]|uniref:endonuclease/exonuclease/phosphatase family protein n=1 Tax=Streptacidiphilus sp. ASG 303 TaxID=2896847 RepID=UPI001E314674|nr:endonuclease/exonuclease/phosphatase family protein [Streptacidiphilus sp. ASG 303]MCD0482815.1 endonuclease/exonuclease/phosphatase family protein [Streptacidiphilus sp. ASG 303]
MDRLRIATFNLLHGQPLARDGAPLPFPPDPADPAAAAAGLAEAVASLDADVLALQEVDRHQPRSGLVDQAAVAAEAMGAADWRFAAALHGRPAPVSGWVRDPSATGFRVYGPGQAGSGGDLPSYGTALLTRLPVHHWRARRFPPAPFGLPLRVAGRRGLTRVPDEPRAALAAVLEGRRGPFTVVAAHLSFVPGWNVAQLAGIRRWISDLPAPYLLLGDFNLVGAVPRTVLGGAAVVDGVAVAAPRLRRRRPAPAGAQAPAARRSAGAPGPTTAPAPAPVPAPLPVPVPVPAPGAASPRTARLRGAGGPEGQRGLRRLRVLYGQRAPRGGAAGEPRGAHGPHGTPDAAGARPAGGGPGAVLEGVPAALRGLPAQGGVPVQGGPGGPREARRAGLRRVSRERFRRRRAARSRARERLQGWRDLARTPTYPSHRPAVQFDHVLAVGVLPASVGAAESPRTPISDHRPLVVEVDL